MTTFGEALQKKFRTPREALRKLGFDDREITKMGFSQEAGEARAAGETLKEFLKGKLSDEDYERACRILDGGEVDDDEAGQRELDRMGAHNGEGEDDPPRFRGMPEVGRGPAQDRAPPRGRWGGRARPQHEPITTYGTPAQDAQLLRGPKLAADVRKSQQDFIRYNGKVKKIATQMARDKLAADARRSPNAGLLSTFGLDRIGVA